MKSNLFKNFKSLKEKSSESSESKISDFTDNSVLTATDISLNGNKSSKKANIISEKQQSDEAKAEIDYEKKMAEISKTKKLGKTNLLQPVNPYAKRLDATVPKKSYTIFLKDESLEFVKDFVFYKVTSEKLIFYNQSDALVESLDLLKPAFPNVKERPDHIKEQEKNRKGGRKRNSEDIYSSTTSCYIPVTYWDFIKNVSYSKMIEGDMYYKDWDFIEAGIIALREKYKNLIVPRPAYIREDEMLRGRRTKTSV